MRVIILLAFLDLLIVSCKKDIPEVNASPEAVQEESACQPVIIQDHSYDTLYPSDYVMAYPGSWWVYSSGKTEACAQWEAVPIHYTTVTDLCTLVVEDIWFLPEKLDYIGTWLAGQKSIINPDGLASTQMEQFIDTVSVFLGESVVHGGEGEYAYEATITHEMLTPMDSLMVGGVWYFDVIHKRSTSEMYFYHDGPGPTYYTDSFFAKNVGLIKTTFQGTNGVSSGDSLISYFIGPH